MPGPSPSDVAPGRPFAPRLARRTGLRGLLGIIAISTAACTVDREAPTRPEARDTPAATGDTPIEPRLPKVEPDVALAVAVHAREQEMVDRIDATVAAYPRLAQDLAPARAGHVAHVGLLARAAPEPTSSASRASRDKEAGPYLVPGDRAAALSALARREARLSLAGKQSAFAAESGAFARVLASMAAAAAQQAATLRSAGGVR